MAHTNESYGSGHSGTGDDHPPPSEFTHVKFDADYWGKFYSGSLSSTARQVNESKHSKQHGTQRSYYSTNAHESSQSSDVPSSSQDPHPHTPRHTPRLYAAPYTSLPPSSPTFDALRGRSRSVTPPLPGSPTPSYLSLSMTPSATLSTPARQLLILDLNGSLLLRSARPQRPIRYGPPSAPIPRRVHRRPYLTALRAYIFSDVTRQWLDVMVWSSAQPHNVNDMVVRSFGEDSSKLLAVWARDTLGLAEDHYHRKVQTVKDLAKPWAALPELLAPPSPVSSHSSIASSSPDTPPTSPEPPSNPPRQDDEAHSALTTLLLDDSPLKAILQPYNHLCIPEYTQARRNADLAELHRVHDAETSRTSESREDVALEGQVDVIDGVPVEHAVDDSVMGKKRKRTQLKKEIAARRAQGQAEVESTSSAASVADTIPEPQLDETLLAVIGILDAVRLQDNVAGWIRSGGTWGPRAGAAESAGNDTQTTAEKEGDSSAPPQALMWFENPETLSYWVGEGRRAMRELGLPVTHGL